ncbi:MAG: c-type cytochrome, partial [Planctomycetota bacterium]
PFEADGALGKLEFSAEHAEASLAALKDVEARSESSSRADGMIDLDALLGTKSNQTAYAFGEFESSKERDVELHVGSDDQVSVWLDGALVHEFSGARAFSAESDHFKAHLLAGKNRLALRIGQAGGDWSFALTVPEEGSGPLFESRLPSRPTPAEYAAFAGEMQGDPARGEKVIQDVNRTTCLRCHAIAGKGEHVGPDLEGLGARYSRAEIASSILSPSQRILDGYAAVSVLTKDDQMLFGQIKQDDAKGIVLIDTTGTAITIERADVAEVRPSKLSVMPEGLCATMTTSEFADLVAYLSRKQP